MEVGRGREEGENGFEADGWIQQEYWWKHGGEAE